MLSDLPAIEPEGELPGNRRDRLDLEWMTLVATREMAGIGLKGTKHPSYLESLRLAADLLPELYLDGESLLVRQGESATAREFRQRAQAESSSRREGVDPIALIDKAISDLDPLIRATEDNDALRRKQGELYRARQELKARRKDEHAMILEDVYVAKRGLPFSDEFRFREFKLPNDRVLRIRVLHPTPAEGATGVDLIYENYWDRRRVVRVAALQYKVWDKGKLLLDDRARRQLQRMENVFCRNHICEAKEQSARGDAYRLPFCSAFLRPTDRLQKRDSTLITSGHHVPVCVIKRLLGSSNSIDSEIFRSETLSYKVFEELFNIGMVGSGWLTYGELEQLYYEHKVLEEGERIIICAQEYSAPD